MEEEPRGDERREVIGWATVEEKLRAVGALLAVAAVALNTGGYLSLRFRIRALGIDPNLDLISEVYLFEGAYLLIFLLITLPTLFLPLLVAWPVVTLLRRHGGIRDGLDGLVGRIRNAKPGTVAFLGGTWALVTVMFFLRHALGYRDMLYDGITCDPPWMPAVALSGVGGLTAFFALLLLLPVPTFWATRRLWRLRAPWRQVAALLAFVSLVQLLLIPIHFGLIATQDAVPHVVAGKDLDPDGRGDRFKVWEVVRPRPAPSRQLVHARAGGSLAR